jgi:hypothetical protein
VTVQHGSLASRLAAPGDSWRLMAARGGPPARTKILRTDLVRTTWGEETEGQWDAWPPSTAFWPPSIAFGSPSIAFVQPSIAFWLPSIAFWLSNIDSMLAAQRVTSMLV